MEEEIFRSIVGYEGHYIVSNYGKVVSIKFGKKKEIKPFLWSNGRYYYFHTCVDGIHGKLSVARAVAQAFPEICGEWFEGCTVDHINTITTDNRAENLRVVSLKDNINNPLTIEKMRRYKTDEERAEIKKQQKREDYQKHKEYYGNYMAKYYAEHKEQYKEYYKNHPLTEEQKEKNRQRARKYYYDHKEEIAAKNKKPPKKDIREIIKKVG